MNPSSTTNASAGHIHEMSLSYVFPYTGASNTCRKWTLSGIGLRLEEIVVLGLEVVCISPVHLLLSLIIVYYVSDSLYECQMYESEV